MIYNPLKIFAALVLLTATITSAADPEQENDHDVVVIGGTPAGVAAAIAAARAIAEFAERRGLSETNILPTMAEWECVPEIAVATAMQAQKDGLAHLQRTENEIRTGALNAILNTRHAVETLMQEGLIADPPAD